MRPTRIIPALAIITLLTAGPAAGQLTFPRLPFSAARTRTAPNAPQYGPQYAPPRKTYSSWPGSVAPTAAQPIQQVAMERPSARHMIGPRLTIPPPARMSDFSLIHPKHAELQVFDIVTIVVDEKSELQRNQKFNRQKNARLLADLKEFIRLGPNGNLVNAAANNPKVDANLQSTLNSTGQVTDTEGIKYRIAATIMDVHPNGTLVLEAKKTIQTQDGESIYKLTGILRAQDVGPDNTASSENIANLNIMKAQSGRVYDSTKRNWGQRLFDFLTPF